MAEGSATTGGEIASKGRESTPECNRTLYLRYGELTPPWPSPLGGARTSGAEPLTRLAAEAASHPLPRGERGRGDDQGVR